MVQREDDTEEAIRRRLELYERQTAPLIEWYSEHGLLADDQRDRRAPTRSPGGCVRAIEDRRGRAAEPDLGDLVRRNADELAKMRRAGRVVAEMHEATRAAVRPGITTAELDAVAREVLERRGATSNFLGYHGFPAVICTSPNEMIVHGIPGDLPAGGGRHPLGGLRGHHRGLPRRRRLHGGRRAGLRRGRRASWR